MTSSARMPSFGVSVIVTLPEGTWIPPEQSPTGTIIGPLVKVKIEAVNENTPVTG